MVEGTLSRRYTKAFFQLAQEQKREEAVGEELDRFFAAYAQSPLEAVLNNPAFDLSKRKNILTAIAEKLQLSPLSVHFLVILLERDRLAYLAAIVACYRRMLNAARGRVEAKVIGAAPLEPASLEELRGALGAVSGKEVVLREETDPALLGGLMVELEGKIYDGSVRTQLDKLKQRIAREY